MPAEWEEHKCTWLAWPSLESDWPGKLQEAQNAVIEIVRHLSRYELVNLFIPKSQSIGEVRSRLIEQGVSEGRLLIHSLETDRTWLRDSAPTMVFSGSKKIWLAWEFNAWAKYDNYKLDALIPEYISKESSVEIVLPIYNNKHVVLEGGAIESDGKGTIIVTEECLLSEVQERNPGFLREDYENIFKQYLGADRVIWLEAGIVGDDTHGHIDDICRFAPGNKIILAVEEQLADKNAEITKRNYEILSKELGSQYEIVKLPMPAPIIFEGEYLPASYANFYVANKQVLVPVFNDKNDLLALNIIAKCFPGREISPVYARDLILGLGAIHCLSQAEFV